MKCSKISVYEYDRLRLGSVYKGTKMTESLLEDLERFHASSKIPYFKLIRNGVEFCEYVGVIQVKNIQIEILPKLDKLNSDVNTWRDLLIGMLREVGMFKVSAPSTSMLTLRSNSILDLYFDMFIAESGVSDPDRVGEAIPQTNPQSDSLLRGQSTFPGTWPKTLSTRKDSSPTPVFITMTTSGTTSSARRLN